jgi:hypothetical protein
MIRVLLLLKTWFPNGLKYLLLWVSVKQEILPLPHLLQLTVCAILILLIVAFIFAETKNKLISINLDLDLVQLVGFHFQLLLASCRLLDNELQDPRWCFIEWDLETRDGFSGGVACRMYKRASSCVNEHEKDLWIIELGLGQIFEKNSCYSDPRNSSRTSRVHLERSCHVARICWTGLGVECS